MKFSIEGIKKFFKENWKYLIGALAFIVLVVILVNLSEQQEQKQQAQVEEQEEEQKDDVKENEVVEPANSLSTTEYPEIDNLIQSYFNSMANNDVETLKQILAEVLPEDEEAVRTNSEHTESYNNIICYTKAGMNENTYVVFVSYEAKFVGISTTAPGLLSFYVMEKEDGSLFIQNKLEDTEKEYIQDLIKNDKEVADLFEASQKRYEQALSDDSDLKEFVGQLESKNEQSAKADETTPEPTQEPESQEQTAENETPEEEKAAYVKAKENVNVRNDASESADAIGKLNSGQAAEKLGEKDGWILINYKGQQGYVKADFVEATSDGSGSVSAELSNENESSAPAQIVYVKETANVRQGMSQDSKKIGTAFTGETYKKIMDYADGWTKIDYNGTEAYIKTEFLETR
ncbi:MAG: SH3 domain-containing protein [Lachnospiraceae bacterium]|nr:SH3 domain-containing protein [Lachnospiraceae bacterium]